MIYGVQLSILSKFSKLSIKIYWNKRDEIGFVLKIRMFHILNRKNILWNLTNNHILYYSFCIVCYQILFPWINLSNRKFFKSGIYIIVFRNKKAFLLNDIIFSGKVCRYKMWTDTGDLYFQRNIIDKIIWQFSGFSVKDDKLQIDNILKLSSFKWSFYIFYYSESFDRVDLTYINIKHQIIYIQ